MKSLARLTPLLLIISPFSACMVPERNFPDPGEHGGEGGDLHSDTNSGGQENDPETSDEGSGGTSSSSGGRNGSSTGGVTHTPGTPLELLAPDQLDEPLIWNTRVDFSFGLVAAAEGVVWSIVDGALPQGLSLSAEGQLRGRAQELGEFSVTILASSASGDEGELEVELSVASRSWIAYLLVNHENGETRLFAADLAGASSSPLEIENAPSAGRFGPISFSPDGKSLAYLVDEDGDPADCEVKMARLDGDDSPTAKTVGSAKAACDEPFRWSPDGSAFVHLRLSGSSRVPVLVRTLSSTESYFIFSNQASANASGIDWVSNDLVLYYKESGSPALALDVTNSALENPRALGTAQSTTHINSDEARLAGPLGNELEVIDVDDDWNVTFSTIDRAVSPGLHYTVLRASDATLHVHTVDSFDMPDPEPVLLIQREVGTTAGVPWVFFSGNTEQILTGYSRYDASGLDGYRLWQLDLTAPAAVEEFEFPVDCAPTRLTSGWIYCETMELGQTRSYAHRPGFNTVAHATVGDPAVDTLLHPPVVAPDWSGILQTWGDTDTATSGVFRFGFSDDDATPTRVRLAPEQDATAVHVMTEVQRRPVWTGDSAFAAFVMDRPTGSLSSSAVWARYLPGTSTPVNVSTSNATCSGTTAQNDCLEITQLVSQPAVVIGK